MARFRQALWSLLKRVQRRVSGRPGPDADAHRQVVLDTYCSSLDNWTQTLKKSMEIVLNGDYVADSGRSRRPVRLRQHRRSRCRWRMVSPARSRGL
eukprot:7350801-Lingulodinium_polyedra.AAC.1